jgi:hypothetical protein
MEAIGYVLFILMAIWAIGWVLLALRGTDW